MGLEYVDIFYSHRFDPDTPLEETMGALDAAVRAGKARYVGISSYGPRRTEEAAQILRELGTPLLIHQPSYSMLNRWIEEELLDVLEREGVGVIVFSPLAQGLLTDQYLDGIPEDSRVRRGNYFSSELLDRREPRARPRAERDRRAPRPVAGAAGDRLDAARRARHLGAGRRRRASRSSSRTSPRWSDADFDADELEEIDRYAVDGSLNIWDAVEQRVARRAPALLLDDDLARVRSRRTAAGLLWTVTLNVPLGR